MRLAQLIIISGLFLYSTVKGQVQSINIAGSYSGSFLISGSSEPYQIAGSPYLSESWMYGTVEMRSDLVEGASVRDSRKIAEYRKAIRQCDALIEKLTDPRFETKGISLILDEIEKEEEGTTGVELLHKDFDNLSKVTREIQSKLLGYLAQLRAGYESQIEEIHKVDGLFRYNLYAQEFEMVYDRDTFAIIAPFNVASISVSNKKFIHGFFVKKGWSQDYLGSSYFEVLNEGECKLLVRHAVKIKGGDAPVTYNWANAGTDAFVQYRQLYYQKRDGSEILPLKKRKKVLKELFADKYEMVITYMKEADLKLKNQQDLAEIFTYYNSLES